jgi:hypothetical protein
MRLAPLALLTALAACGGDPDAGSDASTAPTWYQDIAPIAAEHCMGCHHDGGIAPFSLTDYESARDHATDIIYQVDHRTMPPWDAVDADDCAPRFGWRDDPRLDDDEIARFGAWTRAGAPAGEIADVPEPPVTDLTGVTHSVTPSTPFAPSGDFDQFICFVLDPGVTATSYMSGLQLTPGNPEVVHHVVTSVMPPGAALDALVAEHPVGEPFECSGGGAVPAGAYLLNVWTPGQAPMETPSELAIPVLAGAKLVVQFHYHPGGTVNAADATRIDLRLTTVAPEKLYTIGAWGNASAQPELLPGSDDPGGTPMFYIPAGTPDHAEHMRFAVSLPGNATRFPLFAAYPHMHYLGVELKVKIERTTPLPGEPLDECLVNVDRWNFDWQRTYQYDAPIAALPTVGDGDIVDVYCTYDNTLDNPFVQRALDERDLADPIDVYLGEETLDEMCLGIFGIVYDAPAGAATPPPALRLIPAARTL